MTEVVIAGVGQTEVGEHWDISLRDLAFAAVQEAIKDSGGIRPQSLFVGNMLAPNLSRQAHIGALIADFSGLEGIEAVTVEAAGASGGAALRQGYLAITSGMVDAALVLGVEKFTDKVGATVDEALATTSDSDFEAVHGLTPTSQAALLMKRYMHEYSVPRDGFAGFAFTAHGNGAGNVNAMFRKAIKPDTYAKAEMVSDPINLFDVAPNADGAAAVMLVRRDMLPSNFKYPLVKIAGSACSTDTLALHDRKVILAFDTVQLSTNRALKQAGLSLEQIDFFEYHDTFSIYAALSLESAGFTVGGGGWKLASDGEIGRKGRIPCATMGGMKARGFPGGAAGVYQSVEAVIQLQGRAGKNQIDGAQYGLIQSLGGPASTAITHVLQRLDR
jgi:acetyl-CoA C-acetyltransferase